LQVRENCTEKAASVGAAIVSDAENAVCTTTGDAQKAAHGDDSRKNKMSHRDGWATSERTFGGDGAHKRSEDSQTQHHSRRTETRAKPGNENQSRH
jgi:hypothetical protein